MLGPIYSTCRTVQQVRCEQWIRKHCVSLYVTCFCVCAGPWLPVNVSMPYPCYSKNLTPSPRFHPNGTLFIVFHCDAQVQRYRRGGGGSLLLHRAASLGESWKPLCVFLDRRDRTPWGILPWFRRRTGAGRTLWSTAAQLSGTSAQCSPTRRTRSSSSRRRRTRAPCPSTSSCTTSPGGSVRLLLGERAPASTPSQPPLPSTDVFSADGLNFTLAQVRCRGADSSSSALAGVEAAPHIVRAVCSRWTPRPTSPSRPLSTRRT